MSKLSCALSRKCKLYSKTYKNNVKYLNLLNMTIYLNDNIFVILGYITLIKSILSVSFYIFYVATGKLTITSVTHFALLGGTVSKLHFSVEDMTLQMNRLLHIF